MPKYTDKLDNITFIQYLNRLVLEEAEVAMTLELPSETMDEEDEELKKTTEYKKARQSKRNILRRRNRMYGLKNPLVWVFEKIADTELKIAKHQPASPQTPPPLDERDAALVQEYLRRNEEQAP